MIPKIAIPKKGQRNRKGVAVNFMIMFEVMVVVLVVGMSFYMASKYSEDEGVQRLLYTKEIALMVDALIGVPGDALVRFPYNGSRFTFLLNKGEIVGAIVGEERNELQKNREKFHLPQGYQAEGVVQGEQDVCLQKIRKRVVLGSCPVLELSGVPESTLAESNTLSMNVPLPSEGSDE